MKSHTSRLFPAVGIALALMASCRSWAPATGLEWKTMAPERIKRGEDFVFRVEARTPDGQPAEGMSYLYAIDWPTVNGSKHKARTFASQSQTAKGKPGNGMIRIYTYDDGGNLVQVAQSEFIQE